MTRNYSDDRGCVTSRVVNDFSQEEILTTGRARLTRFPIIERKVKDLNRKLRVLQIVIAIKHHIFHF